MQRILQLPGPLDLRYTLGPLAFGGAHASVRLAPTEAWRATRTPDGPATVRLEVRDGTLVAEAWGDGAGWALHRVDDLAGCGDDRAGFTPRHEVIRRADLRRPGMRFCRSHAVFEAAIVYIVAQKVTGKGSKTSYRKLARALGDPAPGPGELLLPPAPERLAAMPYYEYHRFGIEQRRADIIRRAAARARRLEESMSMPRDDAWRRLTALRGIGPWTAAYVMQVARGDADAVVTGDYNLPSLVTWSLAGEPRGDDARMLELLEPYRGHRARAVRLLKSEGRGAPRYGPRLAVRDITRM